MLTRFLFTVCVLCAFLLVGCSKSQTTTTTNSPSKETSSSSAGAIGVPECDDFIAKYDACVSGKVPGAARAQYKNALEEWRKSWRQAASTPEGKASLAAACKQIAEQQRTAMKSFGCAF